MAARLRKAGNYVIDSVRMKETDSALTNKHGDHVWSNEDLDPVAPERRVWTTWNFAAYWMSEGWGATNWSVPSSMVAGGLLWWHALLATIVGHLFGATMTIINGRGGSVYHVGFPIWMRATFGMWGGILPVLIRTVLDMVWFGIQTYFGGLFLDLVFQCIFGDSWTNIPNMLPTDADTTTRSIAAYFIFWLIQFTTCFFRPHQIRWLFTFKAFAMPLVCGGIFIWALVRSGGPGDFQLSSATGTSEALAWTFLGAVNAAINGEFGPLIASEPDITRYARRPRDQIIGQGITAPWAATLIALLGIITASCTQVIYGEALWNPAQILGHILADDPSSKTRFAIFLGSFIFMIGQIGTNFVANLIPFGVDSSSLAPRYINIVRGHIICAVIGGWCIVPWKVLSSGAVFISCITGMGIFMGCLVGIMTADYYIIRRGNYFIEDLYTSDPTARYWYWHGFNWRAYTAYICGIAIPFPGFLGQLGVSGVKEALSPATKIYNIGYLTSFLTSLVVYTVLCKISPMADVAEVSLMPFESLGSREVLVGVARAGGSDGEEADVEVGKEEFETKA